MAAAQPRCRQPCRWRGGLPLAGGPPPMGGGGGVVIGSGGGLVSSSWRPRGLVGGSLSLACGLALAGLHWRLGGGGSSSFVAAGCRHWQPVVDDGGRPWPAAGRRQRGGSSSPAAARWRNLQPVVDGSPPSAGGSGGPSSLAAMRRRPRRLGVAVGGGLAESETSSLAMTRHRWRTLFVEAKCRDPANIGIHDLSRRLTRKRHLIIYQPCRM